MSEEQLKAFIERITADTSLQEKLIAAADLDAVLAIAKEAGLSISADDLKNAQLEISEQELEGATGGYFFSLGLECGVIKTLTEAENAKNFRNCGGGVNTNITAVSQVMCAIEKIWGPDVWK